MRKQIMASAAAGTLLVGIIHPIASQAGPADSVIDTNAAPGGFMSDNVEWLGNIPIDAGGIGARVVTVSGQRRLYVTSAATGLSIYDIDNPALPVLMGHLPLPHFQNEDVDVSADGTRVLISSEAFFDSSPLFVIDTTIPQAPLIDQIVTRSAHTVTCVDGACRWIFSSEGDIYDLDAPGGAQVYTGSQGWQAKVAAQGYRLRQGAHDLNRDASGLVTTDTLPRLVLNVDNPLQPVVVGSSSKDQGAIDENSRGESAYQHNNQRPFAQRWTTRQGSLYAGGDLAPGELLLSNGETNFTVLNPPIRIPPNPSNLPVNTVPCGEYNGPFATWDMADFNRGRPMRPIEVFRPVSSNLEDGKNRPWLDGNPALNVSGCSGHWFDALEGSANEPILVAAGWFEHGTRVLSVNPANGKIVEVGFFQPVTTSTWDAIWVSNDIFYTVDAVRGIDILRFHRDGPLPTIDELIQAWTAPVSPPAAALASTARAYCALAVREAPIAG